MLKPGACDLSPLSSDFYKPTEHPPDRGPDPLVLLGPSNPQEAGTAAALSGGRAAEAEAEPKPTPAFVRRARVAVLVAVWRCQRAEALSQGDALGARPIELQERLGWDGQRVDLSR